MLKHSGRLSALVAWRLSAPLTWRLSALVALALHLPSASLAVAGVSEPARTGPPATLRIRLPFEPATLDWNQGDVPILVIQNTHRGLYRVNERGDLEPDLIQSARTSKDGRTWSFALKPGIHWSDGAPFAAEQAAASLNRLQDPSIHSSYSSFLSEMKAARAVAPLELEVEMKRPVPFLPAILSHWTTFPIRPDLIARWKDHFTLPAHMAGLGPFRITEFNRQSRIVLERNQYWSDPPGSPDSHDLKAQKGRIERIEAWIVADDATALNLYDSGRLDFIPEPGSPARMRPELSFRDSPISYFIGIGPGHPLTASPRALRALSMALDRTEIPKLLGAPHRPGAALCPPPICTGASLSPLYDPTRARTLLREAALPGDAPPLSLLYFNRPAMLELAQWIQAQWKKNLGITARLEGMDPKSYWSMLEKNPAALFLNSKGASYPDPDAFYRLFFSGNPQNLGRWSDPEYDEWVTAASAMREAGARTGLYEKAARRLIEDKPALIPLYFRSTGYLIRPTLQGVVINPLSSVYLEKAWFKPAS